MGNKKLTANDILTSSGRYPERAKAATDEVRANAAVLASKINLVCDELGYDGELDVTSGLRPEAVNAGVPGSAKRSLHIKAMACDFKSQGLGLAVRAHPNGAEILRKHRLFMEALESTPTWTHIDQGSRADRPNREFKP